MNSKTEKINQYTGYKYENLLNLLLNINTNLDNINGIDFSLVFSNLFYIFSSISKTIALSFSDLNDKIKIVQKHFLTNYPEMETIQEVIELEINENLYNLNGENKQIKTNYISLSRTTLRLAWYLKFILDSFCHMAKTEDSLSKCIKKSYETNLAPHHNWLTQKGALLGISLVSNNKNTILNKLTDNSTNIEKVCQLTNEMEKLYDYLIQYLNFKNLNNTN